MTTITTQSQANPNSVAPCHKCEDGVALVREFQDAATEYGHQAKRLSTYNGDYLTITSTKIVTADGTEYELVKTAGISQSRAAAVQRFKEVCRE